MKSIVKINQEIFNLNSELVENGGELTEELQEQWEQTFSDIQKKAPNIAKVYRENEYTLDAIKKEKQRLSDMEKKIKNTNQFYKSAIQNAMEQMDIDRIENNGEVIRIQNFQSSLQIDDINAIPNEYKTWVVEPDKASIKKALKDGDKIDGASLIENRGLVIKK